jgi:hypothetical protein
MDCFEPPSSSLDNKISLKLRAFDCDAFVDLPSDAQINKISDEYIRLPTDNNHLFDGTFEIL